jgi:hypothetical protein
MEMVLKRQLTTVLTSNSGSRGCDSPGLTLGGSTMGLSGYGPLGSDVLLTKVGLI